MSDKLFGNRWKNIEPLGEGGQGYLFKVEDTADGGKVYVLKRLKNKKRIERFKDEIEAIKLLDHPNIIKLVDFDLENDKPFFVIQYCEGGELTFERLKNFTPVEKLTLFLEICKAIGHAHEKGIVHRDIKPQNILFLDDINPIPIITDFGICFNTEEGLERLTETIEQAGSRYYMPPELADGRANDVTFKSDVYCLGKLLYWMFAGEIFDREKENGESKYLKERWDLRKLPELSDSILFVYEILDKTICENPEDRFVDANHLVKKVEEVVSALRNEGRFLDAQVPSKCLFCGKGKYSKKTIDPVIGKVMPSAEYNVDYRQSEIINSPQDQKAFHLPEGNLRQGLYRHYLTLMCDYCGNCQLFKLGSEGSQNWKNAEPEIKQ